jgi:hypothetical protein
MDGIQLGIYEHYKGKQYEVLGIGRHSETLEELVLYKALYKSQDFGKDSLWLRPKSMFFEDVMIDGKQVARFKFLGIT